MGRHAASQPRSNGAPQRVRADKLMRKRGIGKRAPLPARTKGHAKPLSQRSPEGQVKPALDLLRGVACAPSPAMIPRLVEGRGIAHRSGRRVGVKSADPRDRRQTTCDCILAAVRRAFMNMLSIIDVMPWSPDFANCWKIRAKMSRPVEARNQSGLMHILHQVMSAGADFYRNDTSGFNLHERNETARTTGSGETHLRIPLPLSATERPALPGRHR